MIETSRFAKSKNYGDEFHCIVDAEGENIDVHLDPQQRLLKSNCEICSDKLASRLKDKKLALLLQEQVLPLNPPPSLYETDFPTWLAARKIQWGLRDAIYSPVLPQAQSIAAWRATRSIGALVRSWKWNLHRLVDRHTDGRYLALCPIRGLTRRISWAR